MSSFDLVARLRLQDDFSGKLSKATRQMSRTESMTKKLTSGVGKFTKQVAAIGSGIGVTYAVAKGFNAITNSIDGAISRYDTLNNFPRVMEQVGFSANESQKSINRLSDGIQGLPTTLDSVASSAQRIAVMTKDLDGATETTLALNNAFISSGSDAMAAERGLDQYVKSMAKGKFEMDSWTTLQETMGTALNELAEAFGYTGESAQNDLYKALQDGTITFSQFNDKLIEMSEAPGGFAERALTASGGIRTAMTNMRTAVTKGVTDIIGQIDKALGGTGEIEDIINRMKVGISDAFSVVSAAVPAIIGKAQEIFTTVKPYLIDFKDTIVEVASYIPLVVDKFRQHWPLIKELAIGAAIAIGTFKAITLGLKAVSTVVGVVNALRGAFMGATGATWSLNTALLANPLTWIVVGIAAVVAAGVMLYRNWDTVKAKAGELWTKIGEVFGNIKDWMTSKVGQARDYVVGIFTELPERIGERLGYMVGTVVMWLSQLPSKFSEWFTTAKDNAINIIKELPGAIAGFIAEIPGKISGVIGTVWDKFKELGAAIPKAIADGFNAAIAGLGKAAKWAIDKVIGGVKGLGNLGKRVATSFGKGYDEATSGTSNSHYHGLARVPYDGYQATLHKNEKIVPASEVKAYERGQGGGNTFQFGDIHLHGVGGDLEQAADKLLYIMMRKVEREGVSMA